MHPAIPRLLLGFTVGSGGLWFATRTSSPSAPADPPAKTTSDWSWRDAPVPPPLAPAAVAPAIAAWRDLDAPYPARSDTLRTLLTRLPSEGFPVLLTLLSEPDAKLDRRLRALAFHTWIETDPAAATRWAAAAGPEQHPLARQAIYAWAEIDAASAASWACAQPDTNRARSLALLDLERLADKDPDRVLALTGSRDAAFHEATLPALFETLSKNSPAITVQTYGATTWKLGEGFTRLRPSLRAWAKTDPDAALAWLVAKPRIPATTQLPYWITELAETAEDQRALCAALARNQRLPDRAEALARLLSRWTSQNPAEALAWLIAHTDADLRIDVVQALSRQAENDHPDTALEFALSLPTSRKRTLLIRSILVSWTKTNSSAARAWAQGKSDPAIAYAAPSMHAATLGNLAQQDPAAAIAEARQITEPNARAAAISLIVHTWGQSDPAAALRWSVAQNETLGNKAAIPSSKLIAAWTQKDPNAALRWAEDYLTKTDAPNKSFQVVTVLGAIGGDLPKRFPRAQTADLYLKLQDPALRANILQIHLRDWLKTDPTAAKLWIDAHDVLTPAQKAALLAPAT